LLSTSDPMQCRIIVLISGNGTNLQAIIDACDSGRLQARVVAVISNEVNAAGLMRASQHGIATHVIDHRAFKTRQTFDSNMMHLIDSINPDLIVMAGFMRVLGSKMVEHFLGRIVNIHPSLLPNYPGLNTHARALSDNAKEHGATVHFVTADLDAGPIILQHRVSVQSDDTTDTLAEKVRHCEHQMYPEAISWFAQKRLKLIGNKAYLDGAPLALPF